MRSGEEIQNALRRFVLDWKDYQGSERAEAQTFLNELFACYGSDRRAVGAEFEDAHSSKGIMDLHWRDVCIFEMKAPSQADRLDQHREQALGYWRECADVATNRPAPQFVVLCAFHRFEIWEPGKFPNSPRTSFSLEELPDRYETLLFLTNTGDEPLFTTADRRMTTEAATTISKLYRSLLDRDAAPKEKIGDFVLQMVWIMFAEDYNLIRGHASKQLIEAVLKHPQWNTFIMLGGLFRALGEQDPRVKTGVLEGVPYAGGDLFRAPAMVNLNEDELRLLLEAHAYDWREVNPTILGSLMEGFMTREGRHELGAHYTHESDIMKIVRPTIVKPWQERIDATTTPAQARAVLDDLCRFRVLDPACGCGNFLYVAYRELRTLELQLKQRMVRLAEETGLPVPPGVPPYVPLTNMRGIEVEQVSAHITRLTLLMAQKQMISRFGAAEPERFRSAETVLPLVPLPGIINADALKIKWPEADCIIGNPPFLGSQSLRSNLGDPYVEWLKKEFNAGVKDYCVYWFRKTHDTLRPGQRAGLVGTNSIAQNRARKESLEYITARKGVITDAVSSQKWPGEARVHVSIVNWVKEPTEPPTEFFLDGESVTGISPELRPLDKSSSEAVVLPANKGKCFQGPIPVGEFVLPEQEAKALLARQDADYRQVVRPYLVGDDITEDPQQHPRRWVIDFAQRPLEDAMRYPAALAIVRERVKPERDTNPRKSRRERWWLFGEQAIGMRKAVAGLNRYIAGVRVGKRALFAWQNSRTCPSDLVNVFAFDDDYSMGVLSSRTHSTWAWLRSSTLKGDLRYTPTTAFMTFPWPYPVTEEQREAVAEASRKVIARRQEICTAENFGLTRLYNLVDEGAYADLKALHRQLDEAVAAAYGWPKAIAEDAEEIGRRLLRLNAEIAAGDRPYDPFGTGVAEDTLDLGI